MLKFILAPLLLCSLATAQWSTPVPCTTGCNEIAPPCCEGLPELVLKTCPAIGADSFKFKWKNTPRVRRWGIAQIWVGLLEPTGGIQIPGTNGCLWYLCPGALQLSCDIVDLRRCGQTTYVRSYTIPNNPALIGFVAHAQGAIWSGALAVTGPIRIVVRDCEE